MSEEKTPTLSETCREAYFMWKETDRKGEMTFKHSALQVATGCVLATVGKKIELVELLENAHSAIFLVNDGHVHLNLSLSAAREDHEQAVFAARSFILNFSL